MASHQEVAHAWAHQTGKQKTGHHMFYWGVSIYSYGYHFEIARLVKSPEGNEGVLFTSRSYSVSTSNHKTITYRACHHLPVFEVASFTDHEANRQAWIESAAASLQTMRRARKYKDHHLSDAQSSLHKANQYSAFFGLGWPKLDLDTLGVEIEAIQARIEAERKAEAERRKLAKQARFEREAEKRTRWLAGEGYWYGTALDGSALLRVKGDELETSQGASVPLDHAIRAFRVINRCRRHKESWMRNGHSIRVGTFQVDRIEPNGSIQAGCHRIAWSEIERIAGQLGLSFEEEAVA